MWPLGNQKNPYLEFRADPDINPIVGTRNADGNRSWILAYYTSFNRPWNASVFICTAKLFIIVILNVQLSKNVLYAPRVRPHRDLVWLLIFLFVDRFSQTQKLEISVKFYLSYYYCYCFVQISAWRLTLFNSADLTICIVNTEIFVWIFHRCEIHCSTNSKRRSVRDEPTAGSSTMVSEWRKQRPFPQLF